MSSAAAEDVESLRARLRQQFPPLRPADAPAFLDNAAGSLVPSRVVAAVSDVLSSRGVCNAMPAYAWGRAQLAIKAAAHAASALFVNAPAGADASQCIALGPSATALAFRLSAGLALAPGETVVLSGLEHECNASPWRSALPAGAAPRLWLPRWPSGALDVADLAPLLADGKVRLVALTAASNALGLTTPVAAAAAACRAAGALLAVDAVHASPHALPDVQRDDVDVLFFSPYKLGAPHLGAAYVRPALVRAFAVPRMVFADAGAMAKAEYGTPAFEALAGWLAALDYFAQDVGGAPAGAPLTRAALAAAWERVDALEAPLKAALVRGLAAAPGVTIYGTADLAARVGTVAFRVRGRAPADVARALGDAGIFVSAGNFYAPLPLGADGLDLLPDGVVRASVAHYNTVAEVERLVAAVAAMGAAAAP